MVDNELSFVTPYLWMGMGLGLGPDPVRPDPYLRVWD